MSHDVFCPPANLPFPSPEAIDHAKALVDVIVNEINQNGGRISFEKFMQLALYAPGLGYYSAGSEKIGIKGDFITAPEISPLFSYSIAKACQKFFDPLGEVNILEFGAGSGRMAVDMLTHLSEQEGMPVHYFILETSAQLKKRQLETFQEKAPHLLHSIEWLDKLPSSFNGIMIANEVLDAFPVRRFLINNNQIQEWYVGFEKGAFVWISGEPESNDLVEEVLKIKNEGLGDVDNYTSEINFYAKAWTNTISKSLTKGAIFLIDYGFPREIYYHPQRHEGTLMCHYRHRSHSDPLILVGLQDITAHVDFSFVAECAKDAGLILNEYNTQAAFLLNNKLLDFVQEENDIVKRLTMSREIQTLTMPHEMGELFKVMVLSKNV